MEKKKKERWKYIKLKNVRHKYYKISSYGNVKNIYDVPISPYKDKDGYLKCTLYDNEGKRYHFFVHRLVALHFIFRLSKKKNEVNHKYPDNKTDNYYKYLEWCTHRENINHSLQNHLQEFLTCDKHGMATLTNEDVEQICQLMQDGFANKDIINYFGITDKIEREKFRGVLKHIRARKTWKMISRKYDF